MKKCLKFICLFLFCPILVCESPKKDTKIELKSDPVKIETDKIDDTKTDDEYKESDENEPVKQKKDLTENKFVRNLLNYDRFTYDSESTIYVMNFLDGITKVDCSFTISNKSKTAGLSNKYMGVYYYLTFDESGRKAFRMAYEQYIKDFENKKLIRKTNKTIKVYGKASSRVEWGSVKNSTPNAANLKVNLGYEFKNNSPYFKISSAAVVNANYDRAPTTLPRESARIEYYFTKAQAKALYDFLAEDNLAKYLEVQYVDIEETDDTISEADEY